MTSPWSSLDADTGAKKLYLDPTVIPDINRVYGPYEASLQRLLDDALDDTGGYFGTDKNQLALALGTAFNQRGKDLTEYVSQQLAQARGFVKTARDAANAMQAAEGD